MTWYGINKKNGLQISKFKKKENFLTLLVAVRIFGSLVSTVKPGKFEHLYISEM